MGILPRTRSNESGDSGVDVKAFPEAIINEPNLFARTEGKAFDNDSFQSYYKPIDSYEGRHRYDPDFEWEPKEEKKLVRKVSASR